MPIVEGDGGLKRSFRKSGLLLEFADSFGDVTGLHPDHVDFIGGVIQDQEDLAVLVLETLLADMSEGK